MVVMKLLDNTNMQILYEFQKVWLCKIITGITGIAVTIGLVLYFTLRKDLWSISDFFSME
jgi:hypothetical protein